VGVVVYVGVVGTIVVVVEVGPLICGMGVVDVVDVGPVDVVCADGMVEDVGCVYVTLMFDVVVGRVCGVWCCGANRPPGCW
jgi:hypothetical protein